MSEEQTTLTTDARTWQREWFNAIDEMVNARPGTANQLARGISEKIHGTRMSTGELIKHVRENKGQEEAERVDALFQRYQDNSRPPTRQELFNAIGFEERDRWKNNWQAGFGIGEKE